MGRASLIGIRWSWGVPGPNEINYVEFRFHRRNGFGSDRPVLYVTLLALYRAGSGNIIWPVASVVWVWAYILVMQQGAALVWSISEWVYSSKNTSNTKTNLQQTYASKVAGPRVILTSWSAQIMVFAGTDDKVFLAMLGRKSPLGGALVARVIWRVYSWSARGHETADSSSTFGCSRSNCPFSLKRVARLRKMAPRLHHTKWCGHQPVGNTLTSLHSLALRL